MYLFFDQLNPIWRGSSQSLIRKEGHKMRTPVTVGIILSLLLTISGCGNESISGSEKVGNADEVEIVEWGHSALYTDDDIKDAVDTVIPYFEAEFEGCTLTQISYPGDDLSDVFNEWAERYKSDEAIVLLSSFETESAGGDGSMDPNATYRGWQWILVRNSGGAWEVKTYGYG